jgi:putative transposase
MVKTRFPHFNPEVHKIESKIATVRTGHHCKYNINYHIIWIPKYREPILVGKVKEVLKTIIDGQCKELSIQNLALEIMPDHLHLFVGAKPTITPFKIIHKLKGNTSIQLRRCFPFLKYLGNCP